MADTHAKHHDYHLVDPSPWPAVGATGAFIMAIGAINWMHSIWPIWVMLAGMVVVLYTMFMWWRDVIRESHRGDHTGVVQLHLRYGMLLFIASEVMFFVAWFWAFFDASLFPGEAIQEARLQVTGGEWPPKGIDSVRSVAPAAAQHADPAHLGHHGDLGASCAAQQRPAGPGVGARPDGGARHAVHLRPGL